MSPDIVVALSPEYDSIWQKCSNLGHDMIVNTSLRKVSPTMIFVISGLEESKFYKMSIYMAPVDDKNKRFEISKGEYTAWRISRELKGEPRVVWHSEGSQTGREWMLNSVSFDHVRISSNKNLESKSMNNVYLISSHRYLPVLTIYENDVPIHCAKIEHMIFDTCSHYHTSEIADYKTSINPRAKGQKRKFASQKALETVKLPRISSSVEHSIEKDAPSTSSVAWTSEPWFSKSVQSATTQSSALKSIKSIVATPPPAIPLQGSVTSGALPQMVLSNRFVLAPPITPGSYTAEATTTPSAPTLPATSQSIALQRIYGDSTLTAPPPRLMAFHGFPRMPFPMMPMMAPLPYSNPLFSPFWNPLMVDMVPTQPITPPNDDISQATPEATEDITVKTEEIDVVN